MGSFLETAHFWRGNEMLQHSTIALEQIIRQLELLRADKEQGFDELSS